jgi:hypothetical protein
MTADQKREKFLKLTGPVWGGGAAEKVFEWIQELPQAPNVLIWAEGLRAAAGSQSA